MSEVQTELDRIIAQIEEAHARVTAKGGTAQDSHTLAKLLTAIDSILIGEEVTDETSAYTALLAELEAIDPVSAANSQRNPRRIIRALEVYYESGETITAHNLRTQAIPPRYQPIWIGLDFTQRSDLYARIDKRVEIMLEMGLMDEIRSLLGSGIPEKATALQAIGYKEFVDALAGRSTIEAAVAQVQQSSRRYGKRQLSWFRRNENMNWIIREPDTPATEILERARQIIRNSDN